MKRFSSLLYTLFCVATAMIGYTTHHSIGWSIIDFIFTPLVWFYWLVTHGVNLTIIKETFSFFMQ